MNRNVTKSSSGAKFIFHAFLDPKCPHCFQKPKGYLKKGLKNNTTYSSYTPVS